MNNLLTTRRLGALAGVVYVVLFIVGAPLAGTEPKLTATAAKLTSYYTSHHERILISDLVTAVTFVVLIMWAAVLAGELRAADRHAGAGALLGALTATAGLVVMSSALDIGLDQVAVRSSDAGFMRGGYLVEQYFGSVVPFLFVAAAAVATVLASGRLYAAWYRWLTGLVAVLSILGGVSVRAQGFFSPMHGGTSIAYVALAVWVLVTSVLLWGRRASTSAEAVSAAATAGVSSA